MFVRIMSVSLPYRIAANLLVLFAIGHAVGFRQIDPPWRVDSLVRSMQSMAFRGSTLNGLRILRGVESAARSKTHYD
jgi:hypothetical protein